MIQPEAYDDYGEIVEAVEPLVFERTMSSYDQHRIHDTKDLFDGDCTYCGDDAKKRQKRWDRENA